MFEVHGADIIFTWGPQAGPKGLLVQGSFRFGDPCPWLRRLEIVFWGSRALVPWTVPSTSKECARVCCCCVYVCCSGPTCPTPRRHASADPPCEALTHSTGTGPSKAHSATIHPLPRCGIAQPKHSSARNSVGSSIMTTSSNRSILQQTLASILCLSEKG